uniref:receptor protein-tyrosine kinase n=1 Tax=Accipiter nisus TaxID=211598 RepID=A0A8B9MWT9_9AVES
RLRCRVRGAGEPPEMGWQRDGHPLELADSDQAQVPLSEDVWLATSQLSIPAMQLSDAGRYRCWARAGGEQLLSTEAHLELAGLPFFLEEPQDLEVGVDTPFNLSCGARGPPEPVRLLWLQDGAPLNSLLDPLARAPSTLLVPGLNRSSSFSCEAHNARGVTTSRTATVTVVPQRPRNLGLVRRGPHWLEVTWEPGASGETPLGAWGVLGTWRDEDLSSVPPGGLYNRVVPVPPFTHRIEGLQPFAAYRARVSCRSTHGPSPWTHWVPMATLEGVPGAPPENVTAERDGNWARVRWAAPRGHLNGVLRGYRLAYRSAHAPEVVVDVGLAQEKTLELAPAVQNLSVRVSPYTGAGDGPWSPPVLLLPGWRPGVGGHVPPLDTPPSPAVLPAPGLARGWWLVVLALAVLASLALALGILAARRRRKETRFGEAFAPRGEPAVQYHVRSSYSRRTTEATLNSLGISEELKEKLRDVMVDRHRVALGKTLGEGEFGSVMEGQLNQDNCVLKVAVKTMKIAICTRGELEDFLSEAVCMKEFDHPNVMKLIGEGPPPIGTPMGMGGLLRHPPHPNGVQDRGFIPSSAPPIGICTPLLGSAHPKESAPQIRVCTPFRVCTPHWGSAPHSGVCTPHWGLPPVLGSAPQIRVCAPHWICPLYLGGCAPHSGSVVLFGGGGCHKGPRRASGADPPGAGVCLQS